MRLIESDLFRATAAWLFMLLSAFLLLFSFGDEGQATGLTVFYLVLILLLGLFLFLRVVSVNRNPVREIVTDPVDVADVNIDEEEVDRRSAELKEFVGADKGVDYFDVDRFVEDLMKHGRDDGTVVKLMERVLSVIINRIDGVQGVIYLREPRGEEFSAVACYAYYSDSPPAPFIIGETLPGQVARDRKIINVDNVPEGYMTVLSGLGSSYPRNLIIVPFVHEDYTVGVAEIASFGKFTVEQEEFFRQLSTSLGKDINSLLKAWVKEKVL